MKSKAKARPRPERCKECGLCVFHCPKKALSFSAAINAKSYHYVEVDEEKCIGCGICYTTCPDGALQITKDIREV